MDDKSPVPFIKTRRLWVPFSATSGALAAWTNMPLADTEIYGTTNARLWIDSSPFSQARIVLQHGVAGAADSKLRLQYSTDDGGTWADAGATSIEVLLGVTTGWKRGTWGTLVTAARADVLWRLLGSGGDGVADPTMRGIAVEFK